MPLLSTEVRTLRPQPALIIRSRVRRNQIAATIGQSLGRIVPHVQAAGGTLAGHPFARYPEFGPDGLTMEAGVPLTAPLPSHGDMEALMLPGGRAVVAVHQGPYDQLPESFAAIERWMANQRHVRNGPPWELYVTDPGTEPDSRKWITEIYWPVR